jgi:hypothetical protein
MRCLRAHSTNPALTGPLALTALMALPLARPAGAGEVPFGVQPDIYADGWGARSVFAADVDGDGDLDVLSASYFDHKIAWYENHGGQFALPTVTTAYQGMVDGQQRHVLEIEAIHRGRSGDTDLELATLELLLEDGGGTPLLDAQANALFTELAVYLDDGSGSFEVGSDTHVGSTSAPFTLTGGTLAISFADADVDVQVAQGTPRTYFVVATLQGSASSASPNQFQVTHQTESSSTAEDRDHDLPLSLEYHADTSSGSILALSTTGDADSDGLQNSVEAISHDTDPANPDTDGDGLNDGDEVTTHLTDPLDPDMDDDGLSDGEEIALGTSPTDPDEDDDTICDGGSTVGGTCSAGPDNCPFIDNGTQTNSDAFQCGDLDDDGTVEADDATLARQHLMGKTVSADLTRCNVTGPSDGGVSDCDVADIFVLQRVVTGRPVTVENTCEAAAGP